MLQPDFNRVLSIVNRTGLPDRIPIMEFFADGHFKAAAMKADTYTAETDVKFWQMIGMDYVPLYLYWGIALRRARALKGKDTSILHQEEGIVESFADIERIQWPDASAQDWTMFDEIHRFLPDGMKMVAAGGYIFAEAWMMMGFNSFCYAIHDEPELPREIMRRLGEFRLSTIEQIIDHPDLGAIWIDDDIAFATGTMIPPDFLRENLFPWMKKIADMCKSRNIPMIYHSDGNLTQVIPDLIDLGVSAIQPIEPKAMDAAVLKRQYGDRLSLIGGIEIDTLARGTKEEIEALVVYAASEWAQGGGYAFGSSNTIPAWMDLDRYLFFKDCCLKHGAYRSGG